MGSKRAIKVGKGTHAAPFELVFKAISQLYQQCYLLKCWSRKRLGEEYAF